MNELMPQDVEIVGFKGAPLVECGRALPIARRKTDGALSVLDLSDGASALNWHGEGEAESFLASGRWTKFVAPVFVPRSCCDGVNRCIAEQPMVIYAEESMLDTADRLPRPPMPSGEYMIWRRLQSHPATVQAACGSASTVESLLDNWAAALLRRFDAMYRIGRDREYLKRIADFALCAARQKELRWRAFLRYASMQEPDRVRRTFDTFTQREFPGATWDEFVNDVQSLGDVLGVAPAVNPEPGPPSSPPSTARPKMQGIAEAKPLSEEEFFDKTAV